MARASFPPRYASREPDRWVSPEWHRRRNLAADRASNHSGRGARRSGLAARHKRESTVRKVRIARMSELDSSRPAHALVEDVDLLSYAGDLP